MAKSKKDAKRERRAKRLAEREKRFERHAVLTRKRQGDPRFAQVTHHDDGSRTVSVPPHVSELLHEQLDRFRERFGRDPHPDEPVFFDPDVSGDSPVPFPADAMEETMRAAAESFEGDPHMQSLALATADVGYMVTSENAHMFSAHEVEAFEEAAREHLDRLNADEKPEVPDSITGVARQHLLDCATAMLTEQGSGDVPRKVLNQLLKDESGLGDEETGVLVSSLVATALGWLVTAKEYGVGEEDLNEAVNWVAEHFGGIDYAGPAAAVATALWNGSLPQRFVQNPQQGATFNDLHQLLGQDLMPAMLWLCTGLVATFADGDVEWLASLG